MSKEVSRYLHGGIPQSVLKHCDCFLPHGKDTTDEELKSISQSTLMIIVDGKPQCPKCRVEFEVTQGDVSCTENLNNLLPA